jgi:hypothetical protein
MVEASNVDGRAAVFMPLCSGAVIKRAVPRFC